MRQQPKSKQHLYPKVQTQLNECTLMLRERSTTTTKTQATHTQTHTGDRHAACMHALTHTHTHHCLQPLWFNSMVSLSQNATDQEFRLEVNFRSLMLCDPTIGLKASLFPSQLNAFRHIFKMIIHHIIIIKKVNTHLQAAGFEIFSDAPTILWVMRQTDR